MNKGKDKVSVRRLLREVLNETAKHLVSVREREILGLDNSNFQGRVQTQIQAKLQICRQHKQEILVILGRAKARKALSSI